ncbi:hypothetical protein ACWD48_32015 [Streptomyces sp. NPDC002519]
MRRSWIRVIREALKSGDGTLRLVVLVGALTFAALTVAAAFAGLLAARHAGLF